MTLDPHQPTPARRRRSPAQPSTQGMSDELLTSPTRKVAPVPSAPVEDNAAPAPRRRRPAPQEAAIPTEVPKVPTAQAAPPPVAKPVTPAPKLRQAVPPPAMDRPRNAPQQKRKAPSRKVRPTMPGWQVSAIILCLLLIFAMVLAGLFMRNYLKNRKDARVAAYQQIVDSHPIYYQDMIQRYADEYNLEPAFVCAIVLRESSFNPRAESKVGARGLMQLMPDTAQWIADKLDISGYSFDRMYDPETNIRFGCWYLNYLSGLFRGDPVLVSAAYHTGQGKVTSWLSTPAISPDGVSIPMESFPDGPTKTYAERVTRSYAIYDALYFHPAPAEAGSSPANAVYPAAPDRTGQ